MARRKKLRRPTAKELGITKEQKQIRREVEDLAKAVNERFVDLRKRGYFNKYSSKQLIDKLSIEQLEQFLTRTNNIRVTGYNVDNLEILKRLLINFLKSKSSTVRGINKIRHEQKIELGLTLDIDPEDSSRLLEIFEDENYTSIQNVVMPSDLWTLITESKEYNYTEGKFIDLFEKNISTIPDDNFRESLINIYNKYV